MPVLALAMAISCGQGGSRSDGRATVNTHPAEGEVGATASTSGTESPPTSLDVPPHEAPTLPTANTDSQLDASSIQVVPDVTAEQSSGAGTHAESDGTSAQYLESSSREGPAPSSIQSMQLTRRGALGFCIQEGQFVSAQIEAGADGLLQLSGQVHRGWEELAVAGCEEAPCQLLEEVGPLTLGPEQRQLLEQLTAQLPGGGCPSAPSGACDPCLVSNLTFNGDDFGGDPCTVTCLETRHLVQQIGEALDSWSSP